MFEILDNIPGVKFLWHSDFYNVFYDDRYAIAKNLYSNSYAIMGKIFTNMVCIEESESESIVLPDILFLNENVKVSFLKMVHTLISNSIDTLPIIDEKNDLYEFKCKFSVVCAIINFFSRFLRIANVAARTDNLFSGQIVHHKFSAAYF